MLGPCIVTADELDGTNARSHVFVNGETWGEDTSAHMHHTFADLIAYASPEPDALSGGGARVGNCRRRIGNGARSVASGRRRESSWRSKESVCSAIESVTREDDSMGYVVTATWTVREGEEDAVLAAINALIPLSRAEPGCRFYQPNRDPDNPRVFFFYEIYDDEDALQGPRRVAAFRSARLRRRDSAPRGSRAQVLRDDRRSGLNQMASMIDDRLMRLCSRELVGRRARREHRRRQEPRRGPGWRIRPRDRRRLGRLQGAWRRLLGERRFAAVHRRHAQRSHDRARSTSSSRAASR